MHVYPARNLLGFHNVMLHDGYLHHNRNNHGIPMQEHYDQVDDYLQWLREGAGRRYDRSWSGLQFINRRSSLAFGGNAASNELGGNAVD